MTTMREGSQQYASFPKGLASLCFVQIFSTLSFSVLYSTLVLYMTSGLGLSQITANGLTGFFIAFNYGLHLLGGYLGGRFISNRALYSVGMVLLVAGCLILSFHSLNSLYLGLAFFLAGSGLNVTCLNCMVTQRYSDNHKEREQAFFYLYSAMNIGFFSGFTVSGILEKTANYSLLFLFGALGNIIALYLIARNWHDLADKTTVLSQFTGKQKIYRSLQGFSFVAVIIPILLFLTHYSAFANQSMLLVGVLMIGVLFFLSFTRDSKPEQKKMLACVVLMVAAFIFWTLYQVAPMGLTLFIKHNVKTTLFGYKISPQWLQNVNTLVIVFGGPMISRYLVKLDSKGYKVNIPTQFVLALMLVGISFLILSLGIFYADGYGFTSIYWVIISYVLQSVGELLLSPVGYAMIGQLAPKKLQGVMMGSWMMVTGVAATLSNHFSNLMVGNTITTNPLVTNTTFSHEFYRLGCGALLTGFALLALVPFLKRLMDDEEPDEGVADIIDVEMA